jgi:hypothetical protein
MWLVVVAVRLTTLEPFVWLMRTTSSTSPLECVTGCCDRAYLEWACELPTGDVCHIMLIGVLSVVRLTNSNFELYAKIGLPMLMMFLVRGGDV